MCLVSMGLLCNTLTIDKHGYHLLPAYNHLTTSCAHHQLCIMSGNSACSSSFDSPHHLDEHGMLFAEPQLILHKWSLNNSTYHPHHIRYLESLFGTTTDYVLFVIAVSIMIHLIGNCNYTMSEQCKHIYQQYSSLQTPQKSHTTTTIPQSMIGVLVSPLTMLYLLLQCKRALV